MMNFTKDIYFDKEKIYENSELNITYTGQLSSSEKVYISYGYGNLWDNKNEIELSKNSTGFFGTIKIESGIDLQFCFHDSNNCWDNNNTQNYIVPIYKEETKFQTSKQISVSEDSLKFEPIIVSEKEIDLNLDTTPSVYTTAPFKPITVSSKTVDIYSKPETNNIENIVIPKEIKIENKKTIEPINEITTQEEVPLSQLCETKTEANKIEEKIVSFDSLKGTKEKFVKAFDDNNITAGSVYVSSLIEDYQQKIVKEPKSKEPPTFIEDITITTKALVPTKQKGLEKKGSSKIYLIKKKIKVSLYKFIKLVKTALHYNEDRI